MDGDGGKRKSSCDGSSSDVRKQSYDGSSAFSDGFMIDLDMLDAAHCVEYLKETNAHALRREFQTLVMIAVDTERLDVVKHAQKREKVDKAVRSGWTGLLWAVKNFSVAVVPSDRLLAIIEYLLEQGCSPTVFNSAGYSAMSFAAGSTSVALLALLVRFGASVNDAVAGPMSTPLHIAAGADRLDIVKHLLQCGADADSLDTRGCSPLFFAARHASPEVILALVEGGADVQRVNTIRRSALHEACFLHQHENALQLVQSGAKCSRDDQGYSPLEDALVSGSLACVKVIIQVAGMPHDEPRPGTTITPIFLSLQHEDIFEYLKSLGADMHRTHDGVSLLQKARATDAPQIVIDQLVNE